jgi:hypothetical protein
MTAVKFMCKKETDLLGRYCYGIKKHFVFPVYIPALKGEN